jgi:Uncharacterised protein family UPF0047
MPTPISSARSRVVKVVVTITKGKLDLGPWEHVFKGEFDGRRKKRALVKIMGDLDRHRPCQDRQSDIGDAVRWRNPNAQRSISAGDRREFVGSL